MNRLICLGLGDTQTISQIIITVCPFNVKYLNRNRHIQSEECKSLWGSKEFGERQKEKRREKKSKRKCALWFHRVWFTRRNNLAWASGVWDAVVCAYPVCFGPAALKIPVIKCQRAPIHPLAMPFNIHACTTCLNSALRDKSTSCNRNQ